MPRGDVWIWLLDLTIQGTTYHLSTRPVTVTEGGKLIPYVGGMDPTELRETLPGAGQGPDAREVGITVLPPFNLARLVEDNGADLSATYAELSLHRIGDDRALRDTRIRGYTQLPPYGGDGEPFSFTLSDDASDDTAPVVDTYAIVDGYSWPFRGQGMEGQSLPWPYGRPGVIVDDDGSTSYAPAVPAPVVRISGTRGDPAAVATTLGIASERVEASTVGVWYEDELGRWIRLGTRSVVYEEDQRGIERATVSIASETTAVRQAGSYAVDFGGNGRGVMSSLTGDALASLGDVLRELAWRSSTTVDAGSFALAADLAPWECNGFVDDDRACMEIVEELIEHTPIALVTTPNGLGITRWDTEARRVDAHAVLVEGEGVYRTGQPTYTRETADLVDTVRVSYGYDLREDSPRAVRLYVAGKPSTTDVTESATVYGRAARVRGSDLRPRVRDVEIPWAGRDGSAFLGRWLTRWLCASPRELSLDIEPYQARRLEKGMPVLYVAPDLSITEVVALVTMVEVSDAPLWSVELLILDPVMSAIYQTGPDVPPPPTFTNPQG